MTTFAQARSDAARLFWLAMPIEPLRRKSLYDTGCGGADHVYRIEENRIQAAAEDRAATARMAPYSSAARAIESQSDAQKIREMLLSNLRAYGVRHVPVGAHGMIDQKGLHAVLDAVHSNSFELARATVQAWNLLAPFWTEPTAA